MGERGMDRAAAAPLRGSRLRGNDENGASWIPAFAGMTEGGGGVTGGGARG